LKKLSQGFEYTDLGPNAGETGWDPPKIWRPGKLKRSEFTETAPGVNPEAARGVAREPEKVSEYDDTIFSGDPTRLMPHLKAIHKLGGISDSEVGIEDLDALHTTGRQYARQAQRAFSDKPATTGPGYEADHDSKSTADGGNEPDTTGEIPIEEPGEGEDSKALFRRNIKGFRKSAAGVLPMGMPRLDDIAREQQRQLLAQAVYEARSRGGELRGEHEPAALALAGQKALEGAQYARLADADVDAINARLARKALEKRSSWGPWLKSESLTGRIKLAEPPPPKGVSSKEWDAILGGERDKPKDLPKVMVRDRLREPITEPTDLAQDYDPEYTTSTERRKADLKQRTTIKGLGDFKPPIEKKAFKLQGKTEIQGIPIAIENRKGSVRKGTDPDGNEWRTKMKNPYGYIKGTKGADGEEVDAYVGPDKEAPKAFVVHQRDKETGKYDEDKVMLGFRTKADAKKAFLAHYDSPKFLGPISTVPIERLRELVASKKQLAKIAFAMPATETPGYQKKVRTRFDKLTKALKVHGDPLGTGHKRIIVPKRVMKEDDLIGQLGFVPVKVAIPETGQTRFESFRHPDNLFHLHEHGDAWIMHKDDHPASTMLIKKWKMAREAAKKAAEEGRVSTKKAVEATGGVLKPVGDFIRGLPHVVTEGIPGAYYYVKGKVTGGKSMRERLEEATPSSYKRQIKRWVEMKKAASAEYADLGSLAQ
jgi:hypothetical protein